MHSMHMSIAAELQKGRIARRQRGGRLNGWEWLPEGGSHARAVVGGEMVVLLVLLSGSLTAADDASALLAFKSAITDPQGLLASWGNTPNSAPCASSWAGVTCDRAGSSGAVIALRLPDSGLSGTLSPSLGRLTALVDLDLSGNQFTGPLPPELGSLTSLSTLVLYGNRLSGSIPSSYGNLTSLTIMGLGNNSLTGALPASLGNLTNLENFDVWLNNGITGPIPPTFQGMRSLKILSVSHNQMSGPFPSFFTANTQMTKFDLAYNSFGGLVADGVRYWTNMTIFTVGFNQLSGPLPAGLAQMTKVVNLNLCQNHLSGPFPDLSQLIHLRDLNFNGASLGGTIPSFLGDLPNLTTLGLSNCSLTGPIPSNLATRPLAELDLRGNDLSGPVPAALQSGNYSCGDGHVGVYQCILPNNPNLCLTSCPIIITPGTTPAIPPSRTSSAPPSSSSSSLIVITAIVVPLAALVAGVLLLAVCLYRRRRSLTERSALPLHDPPQARNAMKTLIPHHNPPPAGLAHPIAARQASKVEHPESRSPPMGPSLGLNGQSSDVPHNGGPSGCRSDQPDLLSPSPSVSDPAVLVVRRLSDQSSDPRILDEPSLLMGRTVGSQQTSLSLANQYNASRSSHQTASYPSGRYEGGLPDSRPTSDTHPTSDSRPTSATSWNQGSRWSREGGTFSLPELRAATQGFNRTNELGHGAFGVVYLGRLADGSLVAVKRRELSSRKVQEDRQFAAELSTIQLARHRNLVALRGYCVDDGEAILVYDYFPNGSLYRQLHTRVPGHVPLDWQTRLRIALGTARGLAYLHHEIEPHIIHRDVKSSNVLLDNNMEARIIDFGLARLVPDDVTHVSTRFAGTAGYMAPEQVYGGRITSSADVYSFGVVLLELVSGRRVVEQEPEVELPEVLPEHAMMLANSGKLKDLIDPALHGEPTEEKAIRVVLEVAMRCINRQPRLRPTMDNVFQQLRRLAQVGSTQQPSAVDEPPVVEHSVILPLKLTQGR